MKTNTTPRRSSLLALVAAVFIGFAAQSQATIINITIDPITGLPANDIDFGILGNNNPTSNFNALVTDIGLYNSFFGTNLPAPVFAGFGDFNPGPVDLTGFAYAVLHYGKGRGGAGQGGGIVFIDLSGMTGNFTFPAIGSGLNGFGGLSSIRLFTGGSTAVPDSGSTVALLGAAMTGVGLLRRYVKR